MKRQPGPLPSYVENQSHRYTSVFLDDPPYGEATRCLVLLCIDTLIINREEEVFFLARRKSRPAKDWLWFIGGRRKFGEHLLQGAANIFARETDLWLPPRMFRFVDENEYFFVDRQQEAQDVGTHSVAQTFCVELTRRQIAKINLNHAEYHDGGLKEFHLKDLDKLKIPRPVKDIVRKAFALNKRKARR